MDNRVKWQKQIEDVWNETYTGETPWRMEQLKKYHNKLDDFLIFCWDAGYMIITPEKYEKLSKTNKAKLERLKLFGKWK